MESWVQWGIGIALGLVGVVLNDQRYEIRRLRDWRHKLGEDPSHQVSRLFDLLEKRVERVEKKVFNGHTRE